MDSTVSVPHNDTTVQSAPHKSADTFGVVGARLTRTSDRQYELLNEIANYDRHLANLQRTATILASGGPTVNYAVAIAAWQAMRDEAIRELMIVEERLAELTEQWQLALPGVVA